MGVSENLSHGFGKTDLLRCETEEAAIATILHVHGEVDLFTADLFERYVIDAEKRAQDVIVDLSQAAYVDLNGVRVLEHALTRLTESGRRLVVTGSHPIVHTILSLFLSNTIPTFDSVPAAVDSLRDAGNADA